ncbi:phospholipase D-like domain-containing protein [Methylorubrum extorquens]
MTDSPIFLDGDDAAKRLRSLLARRDDASLGIAFWGSGALKGLGLDRRPAGVGTRILCDLFSGACNPGEIKKLLDAGCEIRTLDDFHSKLSVVGDVAIVGSSNASSNGLGFEGARAAGNVEANALITEPTFVAEALQRFNLSWERAPPSPRLWPMR